MTELKSISKPEYAAIILIRLAVLWLLAFISMLMPNDDIALYAFMGVAVTISVPYSLWLREKLKETPFVFHQFFIDLTLITGLVYFTGGLQSNLTLLYPLVILAAGIIGSTKQAIGFTTAAIIIYVSMITLLSNHLLTEYLPANEALSTPATMIAIALRIIIFGFFGALSSYISKNCSLREEPQQKNALFNAAHALLYKSPNPTLLLNADDECIVLANAAACELLERTEAELCTMAFTELQASDEPFISDSFGKTCHMILDRKAPLPIAYKTANLKLPDAALRHDSTDKNLIHPLTLVVFTDIARQLELEVQLERTEHVAEATKLAGEMAHEIRTPLTSISASIQLLKLYEERATSADWLPNSPRRKDREELFCHIADASAQLDHVIQTFLDFAEYSPEDLLSIIKLDYTRENKGYIGHLNTIGKGFTHGQDSDSRRRSNDSQFIE